MPDSELQKLTVTDKEDSSKKFTVLINPSSINTRVNIVYNTPQTSGNGDGQTSQYNRTEPERISFSLDLDGTGAVGTRVEVDKKIQSFRDVALKYNGEKHEPNIVLVSWGIFTWEARLESLDINYTLFSPDGRPLRAKMNVGFVGHIDPVALERLRNNSSPDLSHVRIVKAGDTLPLMCNTIYGDSNMYLEVARINGITNFRNLKEGTEIVFPPIQQ